MTANEDDFEVLYDESRFEYAFRDGKLVITEETPITIPFTARTVRYFLRDGRTLVRVEEVAVDVSERTVARHRLLAAVKRDPEPLEEVLAYLGQDYEPEEHAQSVAHPDWEDYGDLHFAQVLFDEAQEDYQGPWGGDFPSITEEDRVPSEAVFFAEVLLWVGPDALVPETRDRWLAAADAAVHLDAVRLCEIVKSFPPVIRRRKARVKT